MVITAGTSIGFVQKINSNEKYQKAGTILKITAGIGILLVVLYMFRLAF